MSQKLNILDLIKRAKIIHNNLYDYSNVLYKSYKDKVDIICYKHGTFNQSFESHISKKSGCPVCFGNMKDTTKTFIKKATKIHMGIYTYDKVIYVNSLTKVIICCNKHGDFKQIPGNHINKKAGCPKCRASKGELKILQFLIKNDFKYISEYRFNDCKYKYTLPFDFFLPDYNICLEYDGIQHFKESTLFIESLDSIKLRDGIKNKYCLDKKINLIRISYKDYDHIEKILEKEINGF